MNLNKLLEQVIENKYKELGLEKEDSGRFRKIKFFEGNAIGQIGENFVKQVFRKEKIPLDNTKSVVHDEYDILSKGRKIEIKTARKGAKNNSFQFNGINPQYNHDYIILVGITSDAVYYNIVSEKSTYDHRKRKHFLKVNDQLKQLVSMNPGNSVNYKLTLTISQLKPISSFVKELHSLLD